MHRILRVPWKTHNNMFPHLAGMIDPELWFAKRCIKFINMCMKSDNNSKYSQNYSQFVWLIIECQVLNVV